ncbi:MAG: hypothetical protein P4L84_01705 [Isosphaeraceae bacterium]|nr:hypothetical protein [Isosphaeraceae bacterium]
MNRLAGSAKTDSSTSSFPARRQLLAAALTSFLFLLVAALARDVYWLLAVLFVTITLLASRHRIRPVLTWALSSTPVVTASAGREPVAEDRSVSREAARGGARVNQADVPEELVAPGLSMEDGADGLVSSDPAAPSDEAASRSKVPVQRGRKRRARNPVAVRPAVAWVQVSPGRYVRVEEAPSTDDRSGSGAAGDPEEGVEPASLPATPATTSPVGHAESAVDALLEVSSSTPAGASHNDDRPGESE